jgi:hypothetical protein
MSNSIPLNSLLFALYASVGSCFQDSCVSVSVSSLHMYPRPKLHSVALPSVAFSFHVSRTTIIRLALYHVQQSEYRSGSALPAQLELYPTFGSLPLVHIRSCLVAQAPRLSAKLIGSPVTPPSFLAPTPDAPSVRPESLQWAMFSLGDLGRAG